MKDVVLLIVKHVEAGDRKVFKIASGRKNAPEVS